MTSHTEAWIRQRWVRLGIAVYLLAVVVRIAFLIEARWNNPLYQWLTTDERLHHETVLTMINGTAPATPYLRAPGYLYFLCGLYKIAGPYPMVARALQVFLAALGPVLIFLIGGRMFGPLAGLVGGGLGAVFWTFVFFSTELLDASLASVLYLLLAYLLVALPDERWTKWAACGLILGLGAIVRPNVLAVAPVLAVMMAWNARHTPASGEGDRVRLLRGAARNVAILAVGTMLAIAPITLRNLWVSGQVVMIGMWGSGTFYATNNPDSDAKRMFAPKTYTDRSPPMTELLKDPLFRYDELCRLMYVQAANQLGHLPTYREAADFFTRLSLEYIRDYPGKLVGDLFKRLCFTFNAYEYPFNKDIYDFVRFTPLLRDLSWLHFGVLCPLGMVGLVSVLVRRTWPAGFSYYLAMLAALVIPGTLFPVISRYRLPIVYLMMPLVGWGLVYVIRRLTPPIHWRGLVQPAGLLAFFGVFCNVNVFGLRPHHCEYLLPHFFGACVATERHDLAAETSDRIERVLNDPAFYHEIPSAAIRPLFEYFHDRHDTRRAAVYGWEMLRRRLSAEPKTFDAMVKVFIDRGEPEKARVALNALTETSQGGPDVYVAQACYRYGRAYGDRESLLKAEQLYLALSRLHPEEERYRAAVTAIRRLLAPATSTGPASARAVHDCP